MNPAKLSCKQEGRAQVLQPVSENGGVVTLCCAIAIDTQPEVDLVFSVVCAHHSPWSF